MKSEILSLETIISELEFLRKTVIISWDVWKTGRFVAACNQSNRKKYLILGMLKNTINHL